MKGVHLISKYKPILNEGQKQRFQGYLPGKVYKTERNISILVALSQLCMMFLFLMNNSVSRERPRALRYFILYIFLFVSTCGAIMLYRYTFRNKKIMGFIWLRRIYVSLLCIWVLGITFMELDAGKAVSVYCYLMPTTAALLLLSPMEGTVIFGGTGVLLAILVFCVEGARGHVFSNLVNSSFVTILTLFISYRYYRSMAVEFCDRETIASQYEEIQQSNCLLQQLVQLDQLTGLYNRHYLMDTIYPMFESWRQKKCSGMFLMLDIDYFKQYNDTYGHIQGDECLQRVSDVLRRFCDQEKTSAIRYGGEEFLVIRMSEEPFDGAASAERLLLQFKKAGIERTDVECGQVTVSIGMWQGELSEVPHIDSVIKCADDALYRAKSMGRNQIVKGCMLKHSN